MSRSLTVVVVATVVAVVVVVGFVVGFSVSDLSPAAVRVNGDEVSQQQLNSELRGFADSTFFAQPFAQAQPPVAFKVSDGAVSSLAGAQWLGYRIENSLVEQALARRHASVTKKDLDTARKALVGQGVLAGMNDSAADQLTRLQASLTKLVKTVGSQAAARTELQKAARKAHVTIDERYGAWNQTQLGVCPRAGCAASSRCCLPRRSRSGARASSSSGSVPRGPTTSSPPARDALESATVRFVRTRRHPAVAELEAGGMTFTAFDDVYDAAPDLESAYARMVELLVGRGCAACTRFPAIPPSPNARSCCSASGGSTSTSCPASRSPSSPGRAWGSTRWHVRAASSTRVRSTRSSSPARCSSRSATTRSCSPT